MAIHKLPDYHKIVIHLNVNLGKKQFGIPPIVCE